jgi:hypothetical protein
MLFDPLKQLLPPKITFFYEKNYNFETVSHRDIKTTEMPSLTFDLKKKVKVKGQGHLNSMKIGLFHNSFTT